MKKLFISLVLFATILGAAFAAEPTVSGSLATKFEFPGNNSQKATITEIRVKVTVPVGEYVNLVMDLRDDSNKANFFRFHTLHATSDISGALGIEPVSIKLKFGRFATNLDAGNGKGYVRGGTNLTGRNDARDITGSVNIEEQKEPVLDALVATKGGTADVSLDIGVMDYVTLLTYASFDGNAFQHKAGLKLGKGVLEGLTFAVSYAAESTGTEFYVKADAGYEIKLMDDNISIKPFAAGRYVIKANETEKNPYKARTFLWAAGVNFSGFGVKVNLGFASNKDSSDFGAIDTSVSYTIADFTAKVTPTINVHNKDEPIDKIDLKLSYKIMETQFEVGYVFDIGKEAGSGLYIVTKVAY